MTKYFTNNFTILDLHKKPSIKSETVTQIIFGDSFSITKRSKKWLKIRIKEDGYNGYIKNRKLMMDFEVIKGGKSLHILNSISPAWTSSFSLAEYYVNMIRL